MRYDDEQREWARQLRRDMNEAAQLLWQRLRGRHSGRARFRREHPLGPYTADFYCAAAKLVVELDGASHNHPKAKRHDSVRDAWMAKRGIAVLRFRNADVYEALEEVVRRIQRACEERSEKPSP